MTPTVCERMFERALVWGDMKSKSAFRNHMSDYLWQ